MRFVILGGGWYGCHLGLVFKILGIDFIILEKTNDIFSGSSSKNQNRLHLGFHYPRSEETRKETQMNFGLFEKIYNFLTSGIINNYYAIDKKSLINFEDYKKIYTNYDIINNPKLTEMNINSNEIDGLIRCNEKIINHNLAKDFFKKTLAGNYVVNYDETKLLIGSKKIYYCDVVYDYLINCTYGHCHLGIPDSIIQTLEYELCITYIYESKNNTNTNFSFTLMDGKYFSIYPYMNSMKNQYTLTDVEYTPIMKSKNIYDLYEYEKKLDISLINKTKTLMEEKVLKYINNFHDLFVYKSYFLSYKCKFPNQNDDRSLKYFQNNNIITFVGGKITGIFEMNQILFNIIPELKVLNQNYLSKNQDIIKTLLKIFNRQISSQEIIYHSNNPMKYQHILHFIYELMGCTEFKTKYVLPIIKFAVLFFGYTRNLKSNYNHHVQILNLKPDVFMHTYNNPGNKARRKRLEDKWINNADFNKGIDVNFIKSRYGPKDLIIERNNIESFSINDGDLIPLFSAQAYDDATKYINSQLYTKNMVCTMKSNYEKKMNFKYDLVLLVRFDYKFMSIDFQSLLSLDTSKIYFPGRSSCHTHPGGGGGCRKCTEGIHHFGSKHVNDMCDIWALSSSNNIDYVGNLSGKSKDILYSTRKKTYSYVLKNNISHRRINNFVYINTNIEDEDVVCYYPERLLREYLVNHICVTYEGLSGRV